MCGRQVWRYQPWMRVALLPALRQLKTGPQPTIAFHVKGGGHTPVQVTCCRALPPTPGMRAHCPPSCCRCAASWGEAAVPCATCAAAADANVCADVRAQKHLALGPQEYVSMFVKAFPHVKVHLATPLFARLLLLGTCISMMTQRNSPSP